MSNLRTGIAVSWQLKFVLWLASINLRRIDHSVEAPEGYLYKQFKWIPVLLCLTLCFQSWLWLRECRYNHSQLQAFTIKMSLIHFRVIAYNVNSFSHAKVKQT